MNCILPFANCLLLLHINANSAKVTNAKASSSLKHLLTSILNNYICASLLITYQKFSAYDS